MAKYHTTTEQLAALATKAKPGLLIVSHSSIAWRPGIAPSGNELTRAGAFSSSRDVLQKDRRGSPQRLGNNLGTTSAENGLRLATKRLLRHGKSTR